jgi:hypothetical protein
VCRTRLAAITATTAIGTLTKKIQCQVALSTISPPTIGPKMGPSRTGTPTSERTRPTRCGPALVVTRVIPTGRSIPPPRPWSTRKAMSSVGEEESPQSAEPMPNSTREISQIRFVPNRSVSHPDSGITTASESR